MNRSFRQLAAGLWLGLGLLAGTGALAQGALPDGGLTKVRSAYSMDETTTRIRKDIAARGLLDNLENFHAYPC